MEFDGYEFIACYCFLMNRTSGALFAAGSLFIGFVAFPVNANANSDQQIFKSLNKYASNNLQRTCNRASVWQRGCAYPKTYSYSVGGERREYKIVYPFPNKSDSYLFPFLYGGRVSSNLRRFAGNMSQFSLRVGAARRIYESGNEVRWGASAVIDGWDSSNATRQDAVNSKRDWWTPDKKYEDNLAKQCQSRLESNGLKTAYWANTDESWCDDSSFARGSSYNDLIINTGDFARPMEVMLTVDNTLMAFIKCKASRYECKWTYPSIFSPIEGQLRANKNGNHKYYSRTKIVNARHYRDDYHYKNTPYAFEVGPHRAWSDAFEEAESSSGNWPLYAGDSKGRNGGAQLSIAPQLARVYSLGCILIDNKLTLLSSAGASATEKQPYINYAKTCLEGPNSPAQRSQIRFPTPASLRVMGRSMGRTGGEANQYLNTCQLLTPDQRSRIDNAIRREGQASQGLNCT